MDKFSKTLITLLLGFYLGGCGTNYNNYSKGSSTSASSLSLSQVSSDWDCSKGMYNVKAPQGSVEHNNFFTVCRSKTSPGKFLVEGYSAWNMVCMYPMYSNTSGSSKALVAQKKCADTTRGPFTVDFGVGSINYMYIVDQNQTNAMEACMTTSSGCPSYLEGAI